MVTRLNVRIGGALGVGGVERFSIGLNYAGGSVLTQAQAQDAAEDVADAISPNPGPWGTMANGVGVNVQVDAVEVYAYGPGSGPAVAKGLDAVSPARVFTGTTSAPPQTAAVITLLTGTPGRSYRGRVYWPQLAPLISSSLVSSTAKGLGSGFVSLNTAIELALSVFGTWSLGVHSPKLDVVTPVTSVRCGDVLDTQRRRAQDLPESFTTTLVP